jgi:predicted lipoprotein
MKSMRSDSPRPRLSPCVAAVALFLFAGCAGCSNDPGATASDAKPVLVDVTNGVILPTYRATDAAAESLRVAAKALAAAPSEATLASTQAAWRAARKVWHQTEAFRFGPVKTKNISSAVDFWPARLETIEGVIAGTDPITPASFEELGSNAKGFMALEALLFDSAAGDAAALARLTTAPDAARRRR